MEPSDITQHMTPLKNTAIEDQILNQEEFSENLPDNTVASHFDTQPSTLATPEVRYHEERFKIPQL